MMHEQYGAKVLEIYFMYCRVVLGPEWAGLNASALPRTAAALHSHQGSAAAPQQAASAAVGDTTAGELTVCNTHFIVRQPDGAIDVGIHIERLEELKAAAAEQVATQRQAQVS